MRRFLLSIVLTILLGASASCSTEQAARQPSAPRTVSLDTLFTRLKSAHSPEEAEGIEVSIRHVWAQSGRRGVDALMARAVEAVHAGDYDRAMETLDAIVRLAPDYAEGWNLRATVHYLRDEYGPAVADIERVLAIEPRHFGALSGLGRIMMELGDDKAALVAFTMALEIHPYLSEARSEVLHLREELAGIPI